MDIALQQLLVFLNEDVGNPYSYICFASKKHMVAFAGVISADLLFIHTARLHHTPHRHSPTHHTLHALLSFLLIK